MSGYTGNSYVLRRPALHVNNSLQQMMDRDEKKEVTSVFRNDNVATCASLVYITSHHLVHPRVAE